ncbi:uncharacterized protein LOC112085334 [Eutrema salsugineum]|uniref:uncharacterized protein LOC112085334 n=1 Tax=Eutrema salsugineum TaxID=72664 RepID=UPI000CED612B|nr:uncharacterized protein LOC112085334 [Eutrema salsugineum]
MKSQVHNATSAAPEIDRMLEETQRTPFTARITEARIPEPGKVRIPFYEGTTDPKAHITAFRIAMRRAFTKNAAKLTERKVDAGYCLLSWNISKEPRSNGFRGRSAIRSAVFNSSPLCSSNNTRCSWTEERLMPTCGHYPKDRTTPLRDYMARFKAVFRREMALNTPQTIQDALHRSSDFVVNEEEMKNLDEQYEATKVAIRSSILPRPTKKGNPSNNTTTSSSDEPRNGGAHNYQVGVGRGRGEPRNNTWGRKSANYDEKAFC